MVKSPASLPPLTNKVVPETVANSVHYTSEPLDLSFNSVCVTIGEKKILNGISGGCKSGEVLAVMGPTGAGKTTLLTCLSHRMSYVGQVRYGTESWNSNLKKKVGFVEQEDIVLPALTVHQSLKFSAALRLPGSMNQAEKMQRVGSVISMLRMEKCADTKIGTVDSRGISGGERKRLCIATELLANPAIIFFDEPTSGLDSSMALIVAKCMKSIARDGGLAIITTIHQPNSQVFNQFDNLLLLDDGFTVYNGKCAEVVDYFTKLGHPCPSHYNPPDFLMDLVVEHALTEKAMTTIRKDRHNTVCIEEIVNVNIKEQEVYPISYTEQVRILTNRQLIVLLDGFFDIETVLLYAGLAIIAGLLWVQLDFSEENVFTRTGLCLWLIGTWSFFPLLNSLPIFADKTLLIKELRVGAYPLSAFYISRTVTTLPLEFVWPFFYTTIVFWLTNVNPSFVVYLCSFCVVMLNVFAMQAVGLAISAAVPAKHQVTTTLLLITYYFAYSGLFMPLDKLPVWLRWVHHCNLLMYGYHLLLRTVFTDDITFSCMPSAEGVSSYSQCLLDTSYRINSEDILASHGIDKSALLCICFAVGCIFVMRTVAFVFLQRAVRGAEGEKTP
jgi:ABC-type multidrug transport system ATPase subunit